MKATLLASGRRRGGFGKEPDRGLSCTQGPGVGKHVTVRYICCEDGWLAPRMPPAITTRNSDPEDSALLTTRNPYLSQDLLAGFGSAERTWFRTTSLARRFHISRSSVDPLEPVFYHRKNP